LKGNLCQNASITRKILKDAIAHMNPAHEKDTAASVWSITDKTANSQPVIFQKPMRLLITAQ